MRIGLFTDTYRPAQNGVVVVIDVTRRELEAMGHEVYVFAPSANLLNQVAEVDKDDDHLIHFPAIRGAGFKEGQLSVFMPNQLLSKIKDLKLDILHFFTAGQMAMFCCYAARKTGAALIGQHCTDTYEYSDNYRMLKIGYAAMSPMMAAAVEMSTKQKLKFATAYALTSGDQKWGKRLVSAMIAMWYQACDVTIAVSEKSARQLAEIASDNDATFNLTVLPSGVNQPVPASAEAVAKFRVKHNIAEADKVIIYYGRLGQEKNLELLIPMLEQVLIKHPDAKLVYAGDWEYRETLEKIARKSSARDRIVFVGKYTRDQIDILNKISHIYAFPSLTDTQGLVVTEAAHGGLPIVLCDPLAPACFRDGVNGLVSKDDPLDFADKISYLLDNPDVYQSFSNQSKILAAELTETAQTEKLVDLYRLALRNK